MSHPFITDSQALSPLSRRRGRCSATTPSEGSAAMTRERFPRRPRRERVSYRSSGSFHTSWGPNTRSTTRKEDFSRAFTVSCWAMQPPTATRSSGFFSFRWIKAPTLPKTRIWACSRTAQVFTTMISAAAVSSVSSQPHSQSHPRRISESDSFCWQP